jgi:hypothetical protein
MSRDIMLSMLHEIFQHHFIDLYYCVTCGARGYDVIQLNHEPKRQNRKVLGILADIPFLTVFPQCVDCHDHCDKSEGFDSGWKWYLPDEVCTDNERHLSMMMHRHDMQRRVVDRIIARPEYYKVCRGYH